MMYRIWIFHLRTDNNDAQHLPYTMSFLFVICTSEFSVFEDPLGGALGFDLVHVIQCNRLQFVSMVVTQPADWLLDVWNLRNEVLTWIDRPHHQFGKTLDGVTG